MSIFSRLWAQKATGSPPPRRWFRDSDGTYYRNLPMIRAELDAAAAAGDTRSVARLETEWDETFRTEITRKDALGPGDIEAFPASFRDAYPHHPALWALDDLEKN